MLRLPCRMLLVLPIVSRLADGIATVRADPSLRAAFSAAVPRWRTIVECSGARLE